MLELIEPRPAERALDALDRQRLRGRSYVQVTVTPVCVKVPVGPSMDKPSAAAFAVSRTNRSK